jgi:Tol biopolymer transport system component
LDVYLIDIDGAGMLQLTNQAGDDAHPVFSPSRTRIAFASVRDEAAGEVYMMDAVINHIVRVTDSVGVDIPMSWSSRVTE